MIHHQLLNSFEMVSTALSHPNAEIYGNYPREGNKTTKKRLIFQFHSNFVSTIEHIYRIGTLLFGPSSELANKKASGQLIQDADGGALLCIFTQLMHSLLIKKHSILLIKTFINVVKKSFDYNSKGKCTCHIP